MDRKVVLDIKNLKQHFVTGILSSRSVVKAVDGISFKVYKGETFGIVGESGCGKTTTGRSIIKLYEITGGEVWFNGKLISKGANEHIYNIYELKANYKQERAKLIEEKKNNIKKLKDEYFGTYTKQTKKKVLKELLQENLQSYTYDEFRVDFKTYKKDLKLKLKNEYQDFCNMIDNQFRERPLEQRKNEYRYKKTEIDVHFASILVEKQAKLRDLIMNERLLFSDKKSLSRSLTKTTEEFYENIQMVFQDPVASLNPRMTVKEIIAEGLRESKRFREEDIDNKVFSILRKVGLLKEHASRYPHEFSGGQRQRIGIARALVIGPEVIIADEPISALDVSIQAQIINLMNKLQKELGLTIIFIAHDLSVVKYFSDRIAVMYFGKIVELADSKELFKNPIHPYTKSLLSAVPLPDPRYERTRQRIEYDSRIHDYSEDKPELKEITENHFVYCNEVEFEEYLTQIK